MKGGQNIQNRNYELCLEPLTLKSWRHAGQTSEQIKETTWPVFQIGSKQAKWYIFTDLFLLMMKTKSNIVWLHYKKNVKEKAFLIIP